MKPNFKQISKANLRANILEHREDDKALTMKLSLFPPLNLPQNIPQFKLCSLNILPPLPKC